MLEMQEEADGDFVRVATCATPTEAHLLKGVLQAAGLRPHVADANIVQAQTWMTQALGGVRVLVPTSQAAVARSTIAEFNAGVFQLESEEVAPIAYEQQSAPVFSPDKAVLLSFLLTPVFGAVVQMKNASALGRTTGWFGRWLWLLVLGIVSAVSSFVMHRISPGPTVIFRASFVLSFITIVWYFTVGQEQTRQILAAYGPAYKKKSIFAPALGSAVVLLAAGWAMSEFL